MREPTYFILTALLEAPRHGYMIIKRVRELSDQRVHLATGTIYAALERLTTERLIEVVKEETVNGRARRHYGLTDDGATALRAEALHMARSANLVLGHRLDTIPPTTTETVLPA